MKLAEIAFTILNVYDCKNTVKTICITGDGCAGKTTLANIFNDLTGNNCRIIEIDSFAIPRDIRTKTGLTGYSPQAFDFINFQAACNSLKNMRKTFVPHYSHATGASCTDTTCRLAEHDHCCEGRKILVGVGSFLWLNNEGMNWDLKIFLSDSRADRKEKRIHRDIYERGYTTEEAQSHYNLIEAERHKYILPSLNYCNIHVNRLFDNDFSMDIP